MAACALAAFLSVYRKCESGKWNDCMQRDRGYLFTNEWDIVLYIVLTVIYPVITYFFRPADSVTSIYEVLIMGLFFSATFYYDFYTKYESSEDKCTWLWNVLLIGDIGFGLLSLMIFVLLVLVPYITIYEAQISSVFNFVPITAGYPFMVAVVELIKRIVRKHRGKISKVCV